jgi:hypothetical protein
MAEESKRLLEVGVPRGKSAVEIYRSVGGTYSWRVVVVAEDDTERALRDAQALTIELETELAEKYGQRRP